MITRVPTRWLTGLRHNSTSTRDGRAHAVVCWIMDRRAFLWAFYLDKGFACKLRILARVVLALSLLFQPDGFCRATFRTLPAD